MSENKTPLLSIDDLMELVHKVMTTHGLDSIVHKNY